MSRKTDEKRGEREREREREREVESTMFVDAN